MWRMFIKYYDIIWYLIAMHSRKGKKQVILHLTMFLLAGFSEILVANVSSPKEEIRMTSHGTVRYSLDGKLLHTDGEWIIDSEGDTIILRGAYFPGYGWERWKSHTLEDYERMKSWGFNVVRLPISWNQIEPKPGMYNESYLSMINRDVQWAKQVGIYLVLDMHQTKLSPYFRFDPEKEEREGMPIWMFNGYPDSPEGLADAIIDFWLGKAPNGTEATVDNPSMQDRFIAVWKYVAQRYANETTIAAYDLFNEPLRGGILPAREMVRYLYAFYERLIPEIRKVDGSHILMYEPMPGLGGMKYAQPLNFSNIVFSFHFYHCCKNYTGDSVDLEKDFLSYWWDLPEENPIKNWNIPIWIGEFGSGLEAWARDTVEIFNRYELGWAWHSYGKSDNRDYYLLYFNGTEREHLTQYLKQK